MTDGLALRIRGLAKSYPAGFLGRARRPVLRGLSLDVHANEIFGYLGPNGSGKTTTLKVIMGLVFPDSGEVSVLGEPLASPGWRRRCGFLPEHPYFYDYLTASEYLDYVGRLFGMPGAARARRRDELLELVGLARSARIPLRRFSKGMAQRLGVAQALMNDPELVFLDEPMSGLDPIGRHLMRGIIRSLREGGKTVFFSTHILSDAETLCDRVALLRSGELMKLGRLDEILGLEVKHMEVLASGLDEAALSALPPGARNRQAVGERWRLEVDEPALGSVVSVVERAGGRILSVDPVRLSLEEYFFKEMQAASDAPGTWQTGD
jgi:ABC-2 type transport system ATP-binding protein